MRRFLGMATAMVLLASNAQAEFPERNIENIYPWGPGATMAASQVIADAMGEELGVNISVVSTPGAAGTKAETEALMDAHGVPIAPGGEVFSYTDWNMKPWTPFRAAPGTYLQHDATGPRVGLASIGQLGQSSAEGLHAINASVPQLKRHFLMVLSEWREHERNGEPPQIWTFGVMTHPDKNNQYRAEVTELLAFFNSFTAEVTDRGNPVAQFATDVEVAAVYEAWEGANPDGERLDFNWLEHREGNTQPFPYLMEGVVNGLLHCELDEATPELDLGGDVRAFKLWKRDQALGPPDAEGRRGLVNIGDLLHAVYLLWSDGDLLGLAEWTVESKTLGLVDARFSFSAFAEEP